MSPEAIAATVLYVEDEESDVFFMREAFKHVAPGVQLMAVTDGREALDYLAGRSGFSNRMEYPFPALVLLDLNLPALKGFEVLKWMRQQPQLKNLPVVVFSSSSHSEDKQESDELGANGYMQKPHSGSGFRDIVEKVKQRWLSGGRAAEAGANAGAPTMRMRKLVQNKATKAFLTPDGGWTGDWRLAQVFPTSEAAREAVLEYKVSGVELYYLFGEETSNYDFSISLGL
jgi:CheY-like chemotaxis protein